MRLAWLCRVGLHHLHRADDRMGDERTVEVYDVQRLWCRGYRRKYRCLAECAAFMVMSEWGFAYRQTLVWHKTVAPNCAEFLLVGVIGKPKRIGRIPSNVIKRGPHHEHSRKPELFCDLIEQVSPGPYLELFARRNRLGWDTWGNEALCHVDLARASASEATASPSPTPPGARPAESR